jgi:hypothetical protein
MQNLEVLDHVSQHKYRLPKPNGVECPHSYYDMTLKCWDEMPHNRPTFQYLNISLRIILWRLNVKIIKLKIIVKNKYFLFRLKSSIFYHLIIFLYSLFCVQMIRVFIRQKFLII